MNLVHVGWPTVLYVFQGAVPDIFAMLSQILMTELEQPRHRNHNSRDEFCRISFSSRFSPCLMNWKIPETLRVFLIQSL